MPFDSDVAVLGTGVAALVAANRLLGEGKSVLLLNPDHDFFREDSELPLDPLWAPGGLSAERLVKSAPEYALEELRPHFPGAIELWPSPPAEGFHDRFAPHVRSRARLWMHVGPATSLMSWQELEALYVESSDAGLKPQIIEGLPALLKFPGFSGRGAARAGDEEAPARGMLLPKVCDVDVTRYRNGILEYTRDRLPPDRIVNAVSQIELIPDGVRFHAGGHPGTARLKQGMLIFWTPRLTSWLLGQARKLGVTPRKPRGVRLWEEWLLNSREALDPSIVGMFEDMAVWADAEGAPPAESSAERLHRLAVLRPGKLVPIESSAYDPQWELAWASTDSFKSLARLCHEFLSWDRFSVRAMRPRGIFEFDGLTPWRLGEDGDAWVVPGGDGPIVEVVRNARLACEKFEGGAA
jgi:hypothetical protein